jgi:hypothetical protein
MGRGGVGNGRPLLPRELSDVYALLGGDLTAWLAPRNPAVHVAIQGGVGTLAAVAGAMATIPMQQGPDGYPLARRDHLPPRLARRMASADADAGLVRHRGSSPG